MVASLETDANVFRSELSDLVKKYLDVQSRISRDIAASSGIGLNRQLKRSSFDVERDNNEMMNLTQKVIPALRTKAKKLHLNFSEEFAVVMKTMSQGER